MVNSLPLSVRTGEEHSKKFKKCKFFAIIFWLLERNRGILLYEQQTIRIEKYLWYSKLYCIRYRFRKYRSKMSIITKVIIIPMRIEGVRETFFSSYRYVVFGWVMLSISEKTVWSLETLSAEKYCPPVSCEIFCRSVSSKFPMTFLPFSRRNTFSWFSLV